MKKLANILDESPSSVYEGIFNKVTCVEDLDKSLDTLVIGTETAKKYVKNFSMFNRKGKNGDFSWTFSKKEKRKEHIEDIYNFKKDVILNKLSDIRYEYVSFICYSLTKIKNFITYINSNDKKLCFFTVGANFVFIYSEKYRCVFGLSLSLCEYCGIDKSKIINKIKSNPNNKIINGLSFIDDEIRRIIGDNIHYMLPLFEYFV